MDNRKPPDTNVVQLRRNGDPSDEERQRLASTIFAEQDEIGTFSRGNLVPPAPTTPPAHNRPPEAADPFFEQLQAPPTSDKTTAAAAVGQRDATAAYFERLGSQTPAEMSQSIEPRTTAAAMPGSANLPGEVTTSRRRRLRHALTVASSPGRTLSIHGGVGARRVRARRVGAFRLRVRSVRLRGSSGRRALRTRVRRPPSLVMAGAAVIVLSIAAVAVAVSGSPAQRSEIGSALGSSSRTAHTPGIFAALISAAARLPGFATVAVRVHEQRRSLGVHRAPRPPGPGFP
jgi:hypothetical protein